MDQKSIFELIRMERIRQDDLHPVWNGDHHGLSVLMEEVGEVAKAVYEGHNTTIRATKSEWEENMQDEIVQVAAVCVRWLENFEKEWLTCLGEPRY